MRLSLSRRSFLRSIGLTAAAATLPFHRGIARAGGTTIPVRFLGLKYCNGIQPDLWYPAGSGDDFALETLPRLLAPLEPVRAKLVVLRNIGLAASIGPGGSHDAGMTTFLTGATVDAGGAISLDQHLARELGAGTPFASLELAMKNYGSGGPRAISYRGPNAPVDPQSDPWEAYDAIFAALSSTSSREEMERLRAEQRSVLDHVAGDLTDLAAQLGADDRVRLEFHLESVRELERRLATAAGECAAPDPGGRLDSSVDENLPAVSRLNMDILVAALACRLTHFATHTWGAGAGAFTTPWLGSDIGMHDLSHWNQDPDARREAHARALEWHFGEMGYLFMRLDAIPEEDGQTLLDHTIALVGTDNGESRSHEITHIPFLLAGSAGGALRTGRCVTYPDPTPHNDLLVAIANAAGSPIETFGDPTYCTGPLPRLA